MTRIPAPLLAVALAACSPGTVSRGSSADAGSEADASDSFGDGDTGEPAEFEGRLWSSPATPSTFHIGFNIVNPKVSGYGSCFGAPLNQLVHAGEDIGVAISTPILAMGPGQVVFAEWASYPANVVVVRHDLSEGEAAALLQATGSQVPAIYSQYGHVGTLSVEVGSEVDTGDVLGEVYNWGGNTHVHWEVREFETAPLCGGSVPGPGYTAPGTDAVEFGYLDPSAVVEALRWAPL